MKLIFIKSRLQPQAAFLLHVMRYTIYVISSTLHANIKSVQPQKITVQNEAELADFAADFAANLRPGSFGATVIALRGPLGAGKTTFVGKLLAAYGVTDPVTSPTYTIETVYKLPQGPFSRCYHLDTYRLEGEADLAALDFSTRLADPENLVIIEWAERVESALPSDAVWVTLTLEEGDKRSLTIHE